MSIHGKLVLLEDNNPTQEFELNKNTITVGRAMTNDITLVDARVSRNHARVEFGAQGARLLDLGSSNGTRVNGVSVKQTLLAPGDTINLGSTTLRFELATDEDLPAMTMIDSLSDLEHTIAQEIIPMALNDTSQPRLVVFTPDATWDVPLIDVEHLTIGRAEDNQVVIPLKKVSRHHAVITRSGEVFTLRDLKSTNGTWLGDQSIEQVVLRDGEMLQIGSARLVFKSGFSEGMLTLTDARAHELPQRTPVVFVPGFMGSELWLGSERVWPNVKVLFSNPEIYSYGPESRLVARGILDQFVIVPNLIKLDQYNRLGDYLVEDLGYERGKDLFEFAYDWRQDVRQSARQLGAYVEGLEANQPVIIIAHSLGTLVSRYYIERLGGVDRVQRVILMGGPHRGVPKALTSLLATPDLLPFGLMGEKMRRILASFPSSFQILPEYECGIDQEQRKHNFLEDDSWLPEEERPYLHNARAFRQELGHHSSIPAISIFGYGMKTISTISLEFLERGIFGNINYRQEPSGDDTIPQNSAVLDGTEIHPVQQHHGSLFVDQDVKMRLKLELTRQV
jgi:pSer/pThr/pTyr-binding forkhead associated (FHA) protein